MVIWWWAAVGSRWWWRAKKTRFLMVRDRLHLLPVLVAYTIWRPKVQACNRGEATPYPAISGCPLCASCLSTPANLEYLAHHLRQNIVHRLGTTLPRARACHGIRSRLTTTTRARAFAHTTNRHRRSHVAWRGVGVSAPVWAIMAPENPLYTPAAIDSSLGGDGLEGGLKKGKTKGIKKKEAL